MNVLVKLRHVSLISLMVVLLGIRAFPAHAAVPVSVETAWNEITITISLTEKEKYAGVEMSVELSDGLMYLSHEMDPSFTGLYQYNGTRHLIGGMTTKGKNVFSGKLKVCEVKLRYTGNASETISITPALTRYDSAGKPVSTPKKVQTVKISRPGVESGSSVSSGSSTNTGSPIILNEDNPNLEVSIDADDLSTSSAAFTDIGGHWAESYIRSLADLNYVSGVGNGKFSPNAVLTRAQFVQMLYNAFGGGAQLGGSVTFKDAVPGQWYSNAIAWAKVNNIVGGYNDKQFGPNDPIMRQDITVITERLAKAYKIDLKPSKQSTAFADDRLIASYAKESVYAMQKASLIAGKGTNLFDPLGNATRAEAAKMLYVVLDKAGKIDPAYRMQP
ncbi:S-layer homology domain-containing protein [Paenibacillus sp. MWE-103]|uniref:S-layer homology domain-containing protein n=1 Tax=Paenibacillus artemisiicola TaxID=1172618 RepID=A0ABS3WBS4_9BACL|nr:S-layer homology domain-containing protein [Paenibacillus artemisiicola]MBO7745737.1 S-layer homology domain-containing protein [Paenibacillus artemisiicola]